MYKLLLTFALAITLCSCTLSNGQIERHWWKLGEVRASKLECDSIRMNRHLDVLSFKESNCSLLGDTVFLQGELLGHIVSRAGGFSRRIEIVQHSTRDTLVYFGKR